MMTPKKPRETLGDPNHLLIVGSRFSYFTQKLWAGTTWYEPNGPPQFVVKHPNTTSELTDRAGTHQVPVCRMPRSGWVVADSTPIFKFISAQLMFTNPQNCQLYGATGLTRCIVALMEEYFDEWVSRLAVHERWQKIDSTETTAPRMIAEAMPGVSHDSQEFQFALNNLKTWGPRSCKATGVSSPTQQFEADKELVRIFSALEAHLAETGWSFVLGNAPCAVDASLFGGLSAHFFMDVAPRKLLAHLVRVQKWESEALTKRYVGTPNTAQCEIQTVDQIPKFMDFILKEMTTGGFLGFCMGNKKALAQGKKSFEAIVYNESVSFLTRPYPETSRGMLVEFCHESCVTMRDKMELRKLIPKYGLGPLFFDVEEKVAAGL